jgi:hypothetical protein
MISKTELKVLNKLATGFSTRNDFYYKGGITKNLTEINAYVLASEIFLNACIYFQKSQFDANKFFIRISPVKILKSDNNEVRITRKQLKSIATDIKNARG